MTPMKRFNLYLHQETIDRLKAKAEAWGVSIAEVIRRVLDGKRGAK